MKKKVTIRDVAVAAGVSRQTISRVLNDRPDVAEETRRRVWQVAEELEYQPSAVARSLSQGRSLTLGVVTAGLKFVGPSRTLSGITKQAEEMGYALLLIELPGFETSKLRHVFNALIARQVDGIIWAVPEVGKNRDWLQHRPSGLSVPIIFTTMETRPDLPIVAIDNYAGGRMATEHLLQQGYQHIGHVSGPLDFWEARQRKAGWQDALLEAGIEPEDHHWEEGNWSSAKGERAIHRLLERYPEMEAVFVANDQMALSVLQTACQRKMQVPRDLAVVGFDGIPEAAYFWPPLTTVFQDQRKLGCTTVQELVRVIDASRKHETHVESRVISLQPELIVRASSVRPG